MNYQQFVVEVKEKVEKFLGESMSVEIMTTLKNNGQERVGLSISDKQVNISPTIYLEEYFEQFESNLTIEGIAQSICDLYHEVKFEHTWDVSPIQDFSQIKSKIVYKIIHAEKNETLLTTLPHIYFLDFAYVFYILFEADSSGTATIPITNELMKLWNVYPGDLYDIAHENSSKLLPAEFKPMHVVICELLRKKNLEMVEESPLYVLTNSMRCFGACCLFYDGMLEEIGKELGENYYVIPSSIHEMIIVPESKSPSREDLDEMIVEINETQVSAEEVLSDRSYYYDCEAKLLL